MSDVLVDSFRELRKAWFVSQLKSKAHEREWETEDQEKDREEQNQRLWNEFNADTEAIILGEPRAAAPISSYDMENGR